MLPFVFTILLPRPFRCVYYHWFNQRNGLKPSWLPNALSQKIFSYGKSPLANPPTECVSKCGGFHTTCRLLCHFIVVWFGDNCSHADFFFESEFSHWSTCHIIRWLLEREKRAWEETVIFFVQAHNAKKVFSWLKNFPWILSWRCPSKSDSKLCHLKT